VLLDLPHASVLRAVGAEADRLGLEAYVVGGAVRDALLGRPVTDLDVVAVGDGAGVRLARAIGKRADRRVAVYQQFGTAAVTLPDGELGAAEPLELEFVGARRESYRADSRKPIVEDGTLEDDQRRRDFTVNALAASLNADTFGDLIDPFGGLQDLDAGRLRTPLDPEATFSDDPLRMMRACRFAAQLGFFIVEEAMDAMRRMAGRIGIVSQERVTDELSKILAAPRPSLGLTELHAGGLLAHVLPQIAALAGVEEVGGQRHKDNLFHTFEVVDNLAELQEEAGQVPRGERAEGRALWARWAALFHDVAKPETKRFIRGQGWTFHGHEDRGARQLPDHFRRLKLPTDERMDFAQLLVRLHHRPIALVDDEVSDSAMRRLLFDAGDALEDLMLLVRADVTSKNDRRRRRYLAGFDRVEQKFVEVEERDQLRNFQPPLSGHEIMEALGVKEGIAVGIVKERVREAILDGDIPNEHAAARRLMEEMKADALRRGDLFIQAMRRLPKGERGRMGAIKEAVFWDGLPDDDDEALEHLLAMPGGGRGVH
jgi:poly(A) polymerase